MKTRRKANHIDKIIGGNIKKYRLDEGLSQQKLSAMLDISYQQLQKYESGKDAIRASKLIIIADILNKNIMDFYADIK